LPFAWRQLPHMPHSRRFNSLMSNRREATMAATVSTKPDARRAKTSQPLQAAGIPDALLRISTVQAITGLSRSTIYAKVARREFPPPLRLGARCTRFRAGAITAWLAAQAGA
jgi:prophage regulatory protein